MVVMRILEIIFIVLILRTVLSLVLQAVQKKRTPVKRFEEEHFDKQKMNIVDGEFKEIK